MQFTKKLAQISALLYNAFTACAVLLSVKQNVQTNATTAAKRV